MGKVRGVVAREHGGHARGGTRRGRREDAKGEEERLAPRDLTAVPQAAAVRLAPVFPAVHLHDHHLEHDHDGEQRVRDIPLVGVLSVRVRDDVHRDLYLGIPPETPRVRAGALLAEPMERHRRRRRRRRHRRARDGGRVRRHGVAQNAPRPADRRRSEVPACESGARFSKSSPPSGNGVVRMASFGIIFVMFIAVFAILGMQLFGGVGELGESRYHFDTFGRRRC